MTRAALRRRGCWLAVWCLAFSPDPPPDNDDEERWVARGEKWSCSPYPNGQKAMEKTMSSEWIENQLKGKKVSDKFDSFSFSGDGLENFIGVIFSSAEKYDEDGLLFDIRDHKATLCFECEKDWGAECSIEDITGDLSDLVGSPITMIEMVSRKKPQHPVRRSKEEMRLIDSETWTYLKLATVKGFVTVRWYGESNGYYSEAPWWGLVKTN